MSKNPLYIKSLAVCERVRGFRVHRAARTATGDRCPGRCLILVRLDPAVKPDALPLSVTHRARGAGTRRIANLLAYIAKEGPLFDASCTGLDPRAVAAAWCEDRRIFHVILCPEQGARLYMTGYARAVVASWEHRLGRLEWVAAVEAKPDRAHAGGNRHLHEVICSDTVEHRQRVESRKVVFRSLSRIVEVQLLPGGLHTRSDPEGAAMRQGRSLG